MKWMSKLSSKQGRRDSDWYPTPRHTILSLLDECPPPPGLVIEPCAGDGAVVRVLLERGYQVSAVELRKECFAELMELCPTTIGDWLVIGRTWPLPEPPYSIVTNPPFSIAREFAEACLATQARYVALLLRINVEASNPWRKFWEAHPWPRVRFYLSEQRTGHLPAHQEM